jgi:hypothetical protein
MTWELNYYQTDVTEYSRKLMQSSLPLLLYICEQMRQGTSEATDPLYSLCELMCKNKLILLVKSVAVLFPLGCA